MDNLWFKALMCCVQNMDIKYECECVVTKFIVSLISISTASLLQVWSRKFWKKNSDVSYDVKLRLKHVIRSQMMWLRFLPLTMFRLQYWQYMCGDQWWIKLQLVFILKCIIKTMCLIKINVISYSYLIEVWYRKIIKLNILLKNKLSMKNTT